MSTRYFEDVNVGDELPGVERMPSEEVATAFFTREGEPPPTPERIPVASAGFSGIIVPGLLKVAWLQQFVTDWAGPEATFRTIRVAYKRPDPAGVGLVLTGTVVDKRQEDGQNVVEVEVATVAPDGPSVRGSVQVSLPSRG
ncbi:MAG: hypothetical protein IT303_01455 [Dehalococcoidia bacterium]|nr:hypothetical protein [Dehalococcoidia bacterium]